MYARITKSAVSIIVVIGLAAVFSVFCAEPSPKSAVTSVQLDDAPLTIATSTVGDFAKGNYWHLSVNSAGQAELTIETFPKRTSKRFDVSTEQIAEFRKALVEECFFELESEYGEHVPDGSTQSITVAAGPSSNTVKIHFLMNWVHGDKAKLREPSRAVRLLVMLRGWFDDERAVDLRKYDQMVLDAVKK